MAGACVIKFTLKSSIFVSTETKYVSQIHLDVQYLLILLPSSFPSFWHFLFFSMANDRIACVVSRFQEKLSRAKVQSSGTNFVPSQAQLNAIP